MKWKATVRFDLLLSLLALVVLLVMPASNFAVEKFALVQAGARPTHVADELLVKFKVDVAKTQRLNTITALQTKEVRRLGKQQRISRIKLQPGQSLPQVLAAYRVDPNVEYAQPNYIYYAQAVPDDSDYSQLWGLSNPNGNDIDAELAWEQITDCRNVTVAVLDSGVDYSHQDLATNMWNGPVTYPNHGYDFVGESAFNATFDDDPSPMAAMEDHGSHVAGTIAAVGNNNNGITGVCWQAQIMSVRVLDSTGTGLSSSIIAGIEFAVDNDAKVINMSLGYQGVFDTALSDAISYARNNDVVVVVAAGNEATDNDITSSYPCNFTQDNLVCVAALDRNYDLASFSNYGASSVDVGAPGVDIFSTIPAGQTILDPLVLDTDPTNGWVTNNGHWTTKLCEYDVSGTSVFLNTLVNPSSWCDQTGTYVAVADDNIYKTFDLAGGVSQALLFYQPFIETEPGTDFFMTAFDASGGDPFDGNNDTPLLQFSGSNDTSDFYFIHDLTDCRTSSCSVGFRLESNAQVQLGGIGIPIVILSTLESGGNSYLSFEGTSMATPHVSGIAALVRAYNPDYTYADTVAAIKQGGEYLGVLDGITTTSNAANAMGALSHINPPTGVTAVVE